MSQLTGFYKIVTPKTRKQEYTAVVGDSHDPYAPAGSMTSFNQVMPGLGNRMASYKQYEMMDNDIDISRSLDIIAEEMSESDSKTGLPFLVDWQKEENESISDQHIVTVRACLRQWSTLQDLENRKFKIARYLIMYGDCFFRKTSDTRKWKFIHPSQVTGIRINEHGDKISYVIKESSQIAQTSFSFYQQQEKTEEIPAAAILHFSLSDDMGEAAPYGCSVLRPIFRVYRQLSMLEDAVIIYKYVRAPERRVFYLDVGNMNQAQVKKYLETVKNDIRQKRTINQGANGGRESVDGQYDSMSLQEDIFFPVTAAGRSSRVETLPGGSEDFGTNLLRKFEEKIFRGLRIPTSYMSNSETGGTATNDGKVGIMLVEEQRFCKFVMRLQSRMNKILDDEFKIYIKVCGINIDDELFNIRIPDPTNFDIYRQAALDADLIGTLNQANGLSYFAKRFILGRYGGLTDDEIQMNEILLSKEKNIPSLPDGTPDLVAIYGDGTSSADSSGGGGGGASIGNPMLSGGMEDSPIPDDVDLSKNITPPEESDAAPAKPEPKNTPPGGNKKEPTPPVEEK